MRKRSRIQSLSLCVGGLALTGIAGRGLAQTVTGSLSTTGVNYGTPAPGTAALTAQTINTGFGNSTYTGTYGGAPAGYVDANGSELDAAYGTVSNGYVYIFLAGNLENNGNLLNVFIDDGRAGGQNTLDAPNGAGNMQAMNGSVFSPGFNATYALEINDYHGTAYTDSFNLLPGGTASYLGAVGLNNDGIGSTSSIGASGVKLGVNNSNISTMGASGTAVSSTSAVESVATGIEIGIPASLLGNPTGNIEVMADINGSSDGYLSNQFLPGLPVGTGDLGDKTEAYSVATSSSEFNLSTLSNFWFTIPQTVVANGIWLPDVSGSWGTAGSWSNSYIPHVAGDSASFSNATASSTVTLDGGRTVGSLSFNSSNSYTIAQGTGSGSLTLDNGGPTATASITDYVGNQTISAPVVLTSNGSVSVLSNGSNLTISGNITGAGSLTTSSLGENGRTNTTSDVILSGNNSYGGGTTIFKGTLQLGSATALPANTSLTMDATDSPEAALDLNGFNAILVGLTTNTGSGGNTQIINTSTLSTTATLTFAGSGSTTYPGDITDNDFINGSGGSTALMVASGSLTLGGSITYTGLTTVNSGANLTCSPSSTATIGATFPSGGNAVNNGTLVLNDSVTAGSITGSGTTTVGANQLVTVTSISQAGGVDNEGQLDVLAGGTVGAITETGNAGGLILFGGTLQIAPNSATSTQSLLDISGSAALDITNNKMIINYSAGGDPISEIAAWIESGAYGGGTTVTWTGTGITSSWAAANALSYGIGYADSADTGNPANLASGTLEIMYTLLGDANLDGKVNGIDFNLMATNFNQAVTNGWDEGDFNYDGKVNGIDFNLLASNFNQLASQASAADVAALDAFAAANGISLTPTSVPEPASLGLLTLGIVGGLARRRRANRGLPA